MPAVRIPTVLRSHAGGAAVVEADGETVAELLGWLEATYPGLAGQLRTPEAVSYTHLTLPTICSV